jgi:hypothetical protein
MASKMGNPFPEMVRSREKAKEPWNAAAPDDDQVLLLRDPAKPVCLRHG